MDETTTKTETKERIFQSAADLIARRGYDAVSVREICEAAEVSKPTLYYYFKDKDALVYELMGYSMERIGELFHKHLDYDRDFLTNLHGIKLVYEEMATDYPHIIRFSTYIQTRSIPNDVIERKESQRKELMEEIVRIVEKGKREGYVCPELDSRILVISILSSVITIIMINVLLKDDIDQFKRDLEDLYVFWMQAYVKKPKPEQE